MSIDERGPGSQCRLSAASRLPTLLGATRRYGSYRFPVASNDQRSQVSVLFLISDHEQEMQTLERVSVP
ncbi:hypothetical protein [Streptomyces hundungensis]|uniref:hypothetical protein n=1 Tax=Streptomyces hundungensis TaxID=1077946 RepID=UPI001C1FBA32|nr:hypothetical protein [Streptomyces hundungensis]